MDYDAHCGYEYENECVPFIDTVSVEEDYGDVKYLPYYIVRECRVGHNNIYESDKLVFLSDSTINKLRDHELLK